MGDLSRINTNVAALRSFLTLNTVNAQILKYQEKISTGKSVNRASDDPSQYYAGRILTRDIEIAEKNPSQEVFEFGWQKERVA